MEARGRNIRGAIFCFIAGFAYGTYPILAKFAFTYSVNNATVLFLRTSIGVAFLWAFILLGKRAFKIPLKKAVSLLLLGGLVYGLMAALNIFAISRISASLSSLILCAYPLFVVVTLVILGRDRITLKKVIALSAGFIGIYFLLDISTTGGPMDIIGLVFALGASLAYTAYVVIGSQVNKGLDPVIATAYIITGAMITYAASGFSTGSIDFSFEPMGWLIMCAVALPVTTVPIVFFWMGVDLIGPTKATIICMIEPLATVFLAMIFLQEMLAPVQIVGAALVIIGVCIVQLPERLKNLAAEKTEALETSEGEEKEVVKE